MVVVKGTVVSSTKPGYATVVSSTKPVSQPYTPTPSYVSMPVVQGTVVSSTPPPTTLSKARTNAAGANVINGLLGAFASQLNPTGQLNLNSNGAYPGNWTNADIGTSRQPAAVSSWIWQSDQWSYNGMGWDYNYSAPAPVYNPGPSYSGGNNYYYSPPPPQPPPAPNPPSFTTQQQKEIVKYEYLYGIKDLKIKGTEYAPRSVLVTKPILISGNVMEISMQSVEEHPLFSEMSGEATDRQTSVEYYIAYRNNPNNSDWHPILPEDEKSIKQEYLFFDSAKTATLRFPALITSTPQPVMYKDGVRYNNWSFVGGGRQIQLLENRDTKATYTLNYTPNAEVVNPWSIDIQKKGLERVTKTEVFDRGTNHNKTIVLSEYPYIDYEWINQEKDYDPNRSTYCPIQVSLKEATIAGPNRSTLTEVLPYDGVKEVSTYNITDYKTRAWKEVEPYSLDKTQLQTQFQYFQEKNKIFFSETFNKASIITNQEINHGDAKIAVTYEHLVSNFRVKIILRRTGMSVNSVSPTITSLGLKFKVMK